MIQTPEISIIVPVYKVEHYLPQCLDSIMRQTFTAWECILVDDGSPDNCGEICDQYAARDGRFLVNRKQEDSRRLATGECLLQKHNTSDSSIPTIG